MTPLHKVRVMIIGREPIAFEHDGHNDGLAFSWELDKRVSSLRDISFYHQNILLEMSEDLELTKFRTLSLRKWAKQGVLLWNYLPTTRRNFPLAHNQYGWWHLSDEIIETVWLANPKCIFMLWGDLNFDVFGILPKEAIVIQCGTPMTATPEQNWFKHHPFTRCNTVLEELHEKPIDWRL